MEIYTIQVAKFRLARELGIPVVDTTRKSGRQEFAPDWSMILAYKDGQMSKEEYTEKYMEKMLRMFNQYRPEWEDFIAKPLVAVSCYCAPHVFCHRHLLVDIMEKIHTRRNLPFYKGGEIVDVQGIHYRRAVDGRTPLGVVVA